MSVWGFGAVRPGRPLYVQGLALYVQEAFCTFGVTLYALLHGEAFSLGRAEGSVHGQACSLRRTESPLHVCISLGCQSLYIYWALDPKSSIWQLEQLGPIRGWKWIPKSFISTTWAACTKIPVRAVLVKTQSRSGSFFAPLLQCMRAALKP